MKRYMAADCPTTIELAGDNHRPDIRTKTAIFGPEPNVRSV